MALQEGYLPLKGTLGKLTFLKSRDGFETKRKSGVSGERIAKDPKFARTRENGAEFGRAGTAGKLLRTALKQVLISAADRRMVSRLTSAMMQVLHSDTVNDRGMRNATNGNTELLQGFDFNIDGKLEQTFFAPFTASIDRVTGEAKIIIPTFNPSKLVGKPEGVTHFRVVTAATEIDFTENRYATSVEYSTDIPLDNTATPALVITNNLPAGSAHSIFMVMGIEYSQVVNGKSYPLLNTAFNCLSLVKVSDH